MTNELRLLSGQLQDQLFTPRYWCSMVLVFAVLAFTGCGARAPVGMLTMGPAEPLPKAPGTNYRAYDLIMKQFRLERIPASWVIDVTPRGEGQAYVLRVTGASSRGTVKIMALVGQYLEPDDDLRVYPFYDGTVAITPKKLAKKYASDHAIMIALSDLPAGDPALDGKRLTSVEQERCMLADVARWMGLRRVPMRTERNGFDVFSSGQVIALEDSPYEYASYRVALFVGDAPSGLQLFFGFDPPPVSPEDTSGLIHDLAIVAAHIIEGIEAK